MGAGERGKEAQPSLSSFDYDSWAACSQMPLTPSPGRLGP